MNLHAAARAAAKRYGINPDVFVRQIQAESSFNPNARSGAGAQGIAQFMPGTAKQYGVNLNDGNPLDDLNGAAHMMSDLVRRYGGEAPALSAYNSGRPDAYKDPGFAKGQTYNYVRNILGGSGGGGGGGGGGGSIMPGGGPTAAFQQHDYGGDRRALVLQFLQNHDMLGLAAGLGAIKRQEAAVPSVSATMPQPTSMGGGGPQNGPQGTVMFDGKPVLSWMVPELRYARGHGWTGSVTSGERTKAQQMAAAQGFGLSRYGPGGPLGSNHVYGNSGAVDVSNPDTFAQALLGYQGPNRLRRDPSIRDPVHFSLTGR